MSLEARSPLKQYWSRCQRRQFGRSLDGPSCQQFDSTAPAPPNPSGWFRQRGIRCAPAFTFPGTPVSDFLQLDHWEYRFRGHQPAHVDASNPLRPSGRMLAIYLCRKSQRPLLRHSPGVMPKARRNWVLKCCDELKPKCSAVVKISNDG